MHKYVMPVKPVAYYGGNVTVPFAYFFMVEFVMNNPGTSDFLNFGMSFPWNEFNILADLNSVFGKFWKHVY
jgi:hypothetical protein